MWKEIDPMLIPLTPSAAKAHRARPTIPGDRDAESTQGSARVDWLKRQIEAGEFFTPCWSVAEISGTTYRIDGGHSSLALSDPVAQCPRDKKVLVRRFVAENMIDLANLFSHFDNRKSVRTATDKVRAHASTQPGIDGIKATWVLKSLAGIVSFMNDGESARMDDDERISLMHVESDFIAWSEEFVKNKHVGHVGAVALMFRSYNLNPTLAHEFWSMVRDETGPAPNHPTRVLLSYLRNVSISKRQVIECGTRAQYVKSIHAWNAWQRGTISDLKYHASTPIPRMVQKDGSLFKTV